MTDVHRLFNSKSNLALLKPKLPNDIIYQLYPYIVDTNYKRQFNMVLVFMKLKVQMKSLKRCTPCKRCNVTKTYDMYCNKCDAYLWNELG